MSELKKVEEIVKKQSWKIGIFKKIGDELHKVTHMQLHFVAEDQQGVHIQTILEVAKNWIDKNVEKEKDQLVVKLQEVIDALEEKKEDPEFYIGNTHGNPLKPEQTPPQDPATEAPKEGGIPSVDFKAPDETIKTNN